MSDGPAEPFPDGDPGAADGGGERSRRTRLRRTVARARTSVTTRIERLDRATRWVVAVTAVALVARLWALGWRSLHFDEARVAYWALHWLRTGAWHYRPIVHGPLIQHVDRWLFALLGPSNAVVRLPVAVVGGLLPLSALLYREHLSDVELFGVALVLAANPLVLYYSRFMRSDVLVAAFMFVMLGFLVRLWDHGNPRDLYLALAAGALGFASKENAVVYVVCWAGMLAAVGGMELLAPRRFASRRAFVGAARDRGRAWVEWSLSATARRWAVHLAGALVVFGALTVFLYAPRGFRYVAGATYPWVRDPGAGLWAAGGDPIRATVGGIRQGFETWTHHDRYVTDCSADDRPLRRAVDPGTFGFQYLCFLGRELVVLAKAALPVAVLSVVGFAAEWRSDHPRVLVTGAFAWGVASVLGYPAASDIYYPSWIAVHVVVPLSIPAAVGLALLIRWGRESLADDDTVDAALAVGAAALLVTSMVGVAAHHAYVTPQSSDGDSTPVVQYAQPSSNLQPLSRIVDRAAGDDDTVDVVVYGPPATGPDRPPSFVDGHRDDGMKPSCVRWLVPTVPVSWYLYRDRAEVRCAGTVERFRTLFREHDPAVVITSVRYDDVGRVLGEAYVRLTYRLRQGDDPSRTAVVYVDTTRIDVNGSR